MTNAEQQAMRSGQLHVRVTAEEAAYLSQAAALRGMTVSAFVRDAALRRSGSQTRVRRRMLAGDAAEVVRSLGAIGVQLRGFADGVRAGEALTVAQIEACLAEVHAVVERWR